MKLVLFADLHLDAPFRWASPAVARRRRQALRDALDAVVELVIEERADALCCAGDLYEHERVAPDTAEVVRAAFARLHPTPVLLTPGNHDWLGPASVYARTAWTPNVHVFTSDRLEPRELADGLTVWGAAHLRPAGTAGFLEGFRARRGGVNLGLFHGSLAANLSLEEGGKQAHAPFEAEQVALAGLAHVLVGHFHAPADGDWHTYPGNPEPLGFGEAGERGAVVVELAGSGAITRTRRRLARGGLHDVSVDLTGSASRQEVRRRVEEALAHLAGAARVTLEGEVDPAVVVDDRTLEGVAPHLDAVVLRAGAVRPGYDFAAIATGTGTVRGRFVRDVLDAGLDPELARRVLVTGLRALDGRDDLEVV